MKARFTDEQIIAMIKEQEAGEKTADVWGAIQTCPWRMPESKQNSYWPTMHWRKGRLCLKGQSSRLLRPEKTSSPTANAAISHEPWPTIAVCCISISLSKVMFVRLAELKS
ncbi:hypothetical protein OCA8868_01298 [Octadecabacter ascidiaceicola]|uniref:Transposase n=1 Tax=Octadecabacter ascidiaceicola TaxID=1655543 RepID=A0A238K2N2_9RHOB|nr:hypothetical protein OCA8868_01298 [Octadecabacter ascidiaceicola]